MRLLPTCRRVTCILPAVLLLWGCAQDKSPETEDTPALTSVLASDSFAVGGVDSLLLLVSVEGRNLDPQDSVPVQIEVETAEGLPLEASPINIAYTLDVLVGDAVIGLDFSNVTFRGPVRVCAQADGVDGRPCAAVELLDTDLNSDIIELRDLVTQLYPQTGCRCSAGEIRMDPAQSPDGSLGDFIDAIGGNVLGPHHAGNVTDDDPLTSTMKFEAHFTIEIINPPDQGQTPDDEWAVTESLLPYICEEGQRVNRTVRFRDGGPGEIIHHDPTTAVGATVPTLYPYDPSKNPGTLQRDGWGYIAPGDSASPFLVGQAKAHDNPNLVHWADAPGLNNKPPNVFRGLVPARADHFFHAYVHGSTNDPDDDCDCYFGIRSFVIDAQGNAGAPSVLVAPACE